MKMLFLLIRKRQQKILHQLGHPFKERVISISCWLDNKYKLSHTKKRNENSYGNNYTTKKFKNHINLKIYMNIDSFNK